MKQTYSIKQKLSQMIIILLPILVTQVGIFALSFFDTTMSGHYSPVDLAGVAVGSSLWTPIYTGLSGILLALPPIVSQLMGKNEHKGVRFSVIQAAYLSFSMAVCLLIIGYFFLDPVLTSIGLEKDVYEVTYHYLVALSTGIIPIFLYFVLRSFIDSLGQTQITMFITLIAIPINIVLNYALINGIWIFPELGGVGTGYATSLTYWFMFFMAVYIVHKKQPFSSFQLFAHFSRMSWLKWKEILTIGIPIGFSVFFETSIFSAVTILMSSYDTNTIAAHQSAINFASLLYMVPLSISTALTIIVGYEVGARRMKDAKIYSWLGVVLAVIIAIISGIILLTFRTDIAEIYTKDWEVLHLTAHFLIYAIFFQLSDAIQAPIQGALRGYKDVNVTLLMSFISYWVIGLPSGYLFATYTNLGPFGYWIGLIVGLATGAIFLTSRLVQIQKKKFNYKQIHS
ncbi:MATE family efflux transporter [Cytobacillus oceanisediminis]|uniref:Probable multidrug resistance protein NorM n=1 Tax=Niallia alba TaxID=2729105 RepID=A0A7Y0KAK7_9BACI|nr:MULTISPECIES: MATE family efflux transporter [Bacillaceae]MBQ6446088.1 MATE family efflux transporter [Bacillus sp. (in: firmicutes)]MBZ9536076.1 MATE family efflux transporter [Cytobacillus oceanisediminis]NMO78129.1 MATE family efflux transporter [Niallia alba]UTI41415.1 MATE family efflux transporter [Niallia sp. RD1]